LDFGTIFSFPESESQLSVEEYNSIQKLRTFFGSDGVFAIKSKEFTGYVFRPTPIKLQIFKQESKSGSWVIHEGFEKPKTNTFFALSITAPKENPTQDQRGLSMPMKVPWTTISAPSVKTPENLDFSTPAREVVEVLVEKFNEFRRTFEGFSSTAGEIESTNSQKRKLPDEEMQPHAGDSSSLLDSQGSSSKSAFESHL